MIEATEVPNEYLLEVDFKRSKKEKKLIINCHDPEGLYYGVIELDEKMMREFSHPIETLLWEFETMIDHVRWKSEQIRAEEKYGENL